MSKPKTSSQSAAKVVRKRKPPAPPSRGEPVEVTFGNVTVRTTTPDAATLKKNVEAGGVALRRGLQAFKHPGVKLSLPPGTPTYEADPSNPKRVVQVLNGKRTTGVFEGGKFVEHSA